jgi:cytochrome c oxidase cbb3-type subunit 1
LKFSPTLRFIVFGAVSYTLTSLQGSSMSIRSWAEVTHFTHYTVGHSHWGMYAFFTMVMFGSMYYIMPRLLLKEWPSATLISAHFWTTAVGIMMYVAALSIGGVIQGLQMNNPDIPFMDVVRTTLPYLFSRSLAGVLITIGHIAFAVNFTWMLLKPRPTAATAPTLFRNGVEMEAVR